MPPTEDDRLWAQEPTSSESRFRNIIEGTADGIVVVDGEGVVVFANPAAAELFGQSREELEGERFGFPVSAGDKTEVEVHSRTGGSRVAEMRVVASRWDGRPVLLASLRDVTERKQLEESRAKHARELVRRTEAEQASQRLQLLADAGALLASSLSLAGPLSRFVRLLVPRAADWALLVAPKEISDGLPRRWFAAHADPEVERHLAELAPIYEEPDRFGQALPREAERVESAERWLRTLPEGLRERFTAAGMVSALHLPLEAGGRFLGYLTLARAGRELPAGSLTGARYREEDLPLGRELARRAALALENARLYRHAEEASRLRDEFMAKVSHELRTPLQAILGWTAILKAGDVGEDRLRRGLEVIERNAENQVYLIEDILDVSRIITGKLSLSREPVDVEPLVRRTLDSLTPKAEDKGVELVSPPERAGGASPFTVFADPQRLQQVITNLASNAIRHTDEGGRVEVRVEMGSRSGNGEDEDEDEDDTVSISVADTGDGIEPSLLPSIFRPFRQGGDAEVSGALGLGLAIVRQLVQMHGGEVDAHSAGPGKGATFTVTLPRMTEEGKVAAQAASVAREPVPPADAADLTGLTVAVVDDEADARELLETALSELGATVWTAASAEQFFARLDEGTQRGDLPDAVVSDIGMPGIDGYGLIRRLRGRPPEEGGELPAVALTGFARPEDEGRSLDAGFQRHLAKPASVADLAAVLADLVQEDRQQR